MFVYFGGTVDGRVVYGMVHCSYGDGRVEVIIVLMTRKGTC